MDRRNLQMARNESSALADSQARSVTRAIDQQQSYTAIIVLNQREAIFRTIVREGSGRNYRFVTANHE